MELLDQLSSKDGVERKEAMRRAVALPAAGMQQLVEEALKQVPERRHRSFRFMEKYAGSIPGCMVMSFIADYYGHSVVAWILGLLGNIATSLVYLVLYRLLKRRALPQHPLVQIANAMEHCEDPLIICPALTLWRVPLAYETQTKRIQIALKRALLRHLPALRKDQAKLLTKEQKRTLLALLKEPDANLMFRILKALEQVGDAEAIPVVQKLAELKPGLRGHRHLRYRVDQVRRAAQECLPFLEQRAAERREAQSLLRASDAHSADMTPQNLLRAASSSETTPPEQLLRPS